MNIFTFCRKERFKAAENYSGPSQYQQDFVVIPNVRRWEIIILFHEMAKVSLAQYCSLITCALSTK